MVRKRASIMAVDALLKRLAQYRLVFLDTMVFVYVLERHLVYSALAEIVLNKVEAGDLRAITSSLTLAEVLTGPAYAQNLEALNDYELYINHFPNLTIHSVEPKHARTIAQVRSSTRLRTPDAVQLAVAMAASVDAIIGNDQMWNGKTAPLDYVMLAEFTAA
jgi:predicted nucleic acid-binding protein